MLPEILQIKHHDLQVTTLILLRTHLQSILMVARHKQFSQIRGQTLRRFITRLLVEQAQRLLAEQVRLALQVTTAII